MFYLHKTPSFVSMLYPSLIWNVRTSDKNIYLTFDDGPIPELTDYILENLDKYNAKATFFCVGANVTKYPEIFNRVVAQGHAVGNHTFNHLNGRNESDAEYLKNVNLCQDALGMEGRLFRPPYGRLKLSQIKKLKTKYSIIMWDVLSGDFDESLSPKKCLEASISGTRSGSIVLFHDNTKAKKRLSYTLPKYLEHFSSRGFNFLSL